MKLPRTQTALAAVLLLAASPFALAVPPAAPGTTGSTAAPPPNATAPAATRPGMAPPNTATNPYATNGRANANGTWNNRRSGAATTGAMGTTGAYPMSMTMVPPSDIHAAKNVKVSLTKAIRKAQKQNHGKVIDARFEMMNGKPEYLIKSFLKNKDSEWVGHVDAKTGKLIGNGNTIKTSRLMPVDQQEITAANAASTSLLKAVTKAEHHENGKAIAAGMSARNGQVTYRTEILKHNGRTQMASINPRTGKVTAYR